MIVNKYNKKTRKIYNNVKTLKYPGGPVHVYLFASVDCLTSYPENSR